MISELLFDAARFSHSIGFALGIGAGSFADFSILRKINTDLTSCDLGNLETVHKIVWSGLGILWLSGLIILYMKTGFVLSEFTPKLITKLAVVAILTANAFLLGLWAMPILKKNINRPYLAFSLEHKTILSLLASISLCSWISGLTLGVFSALRPANFDAILPIFTALYVMAIFGSIITTIMMHIIWERRVKDYKTRQTKTMNQIEIQKSTPAKSNTINGSIEPMVHTDQRFN